MSRGEKTLPPPAPPQDAEEGFLTRWSRVKREQSAVAAVPAPAPPPAEDVAAEHRAPALTDEDMPPLESLSEQSDLQPFLSSGVSDSLRRKAMRKIFLNTRFNVRDGLDDYDEDFTNFTALGDVVTAEYRRWRERMESRQEQEEAQASPAAEQAEIADEAEQANEANEVHAEDPARAATSQDKEEKQ